MEGREGIAAAGGHESGHGLFRADISMTEPQEAANGYQSSPSSPSTSPTPSPPPAVAGHGGDATATPLAWTWSLGGEKPSEATGDNGMQMDEQSEHANLSSGRRRGRPRGSGRRQILATLGEWYALSAGGSFTPHVIIVGTGEDVAARIMSFSQKGPRSVCILSANGTISNVTLKQPDSSGSTFTYEGRFEILRLMGSFTMAEEGRRRTGGLSVSLAGPDGRVVGGVVARMLHAASPIQVIVGSFLPNSLKQHQKRMSLQHQPYAAPALPAPMVPPPVLTAAMPISQAAPGNGCHAPPVSAAPEQAHASVEQHNATSGMNLNTTTDFTMVGWPVTGSSQSMAHRPSPDINICLTPQE
ncbi:AT-hook motif nuclear-localized protein 7-like [Phragmites australis]|uniref:AT-hook motif nuclear-localized protein 7-like n=1 Tax=Phragmites australis TaxID=29695 RepID=UPI002D79F46F|nr:AT-hook motif nuclear-localized protein 7-like [Phragmites australis]